MTLSKHPNWGDSAKLIIFTKNLRLSSDSGHHNMLLLIYYPFTFLPFKNLALKINLANMFFSLLTPPLLFLFLLKRTISTKTSLFLAISFGISHLFWHLAVITESYNMTLLLVLLILLALETYSKKPLLLTMSLIILLAGLAIQINLICLPLIIIIFIFHLRKILVLKSKIFILPLIFLIALLPTLLIIIKDIKAGRSFHQVVFQNFLQQKYKNFMDLSALFDITRILKMIALLFYQFPFLWLILFNYFILSLLSHIPKNGRVSVAKLNIDYSFLCFVLMFITTIIYTMPKSTYFLVFCNLFFVLIISKKMELVINNISPRLFIYLLIFTFFTNIFIYSFMPDFMGNFQISRKVPFRNSNYYFLTPWKHKEHSSFYFADFCQRNLGNGDILVSDFTATVVIEYYRFADNNTTKSFLQFEIWDIERKDTLQKIEDNIDKKTIYFIGGLHEYDSLFKIFTVEKFGELYKIHKKVQ
ncbi:MAG: hypothetical protein ACK4NF_06165 [Planctomycetota bacterium]